MKYISSGGLSSSNTFFIISAVMLNGIFAHTLYLMEEVPEHEHFSKEFYDDTDIKEKPVKKKYIPPITHPWKRMSFNNYVQKRVCQ